MVRVLLPAMNSINPDLRFTAELSEDFEDGRLPTLDFSLWLEKDQTLCHTYFEKSMRTQMVLPKRSAMGQRQKSAINSNDANRRISNIDDRLGVEEKIRVLDHYTAQLKNSGYTGSESKEIVQNGVLGWKRRKERREAAGQGFYRSAESTLQLRSKRRLLGRETWFKKPVGGAEQKQQLGGQRGSQQMKSAGGERGRQQMKSAGGEKRKREEEDQQGGVRKKQNTVKSVLFCPYTRRGELASKLREGEEQMEKLTGYRLKVVEQPGEKLLDLLQTSNPWRGQDCGRQGCWLCKTKVMTNQNLKQDCFKRSLLYETWCETCYREEKEKIIEQMEEGKEREERIRKIRKYKYLGETARSAFERGLEHQDALQKLDSDSHLLKLIADKHQAQKIDEIIFGMKVVQYTRSSFAQGPTRCTRGKDQSLSLKLVVALW